MVLHLKNPHSILASLDRRPQEVQQILLPEGILEEKNSGQISEDAWKKVAHIGKNLKIPMKSISGRRPSVVKEGAGREGVAEAAVLEKNPVSLEEVFSEVSDLVGGLWIALDCLQDPQNVGAVFRTAAFFGVRGMILTQDRSVRLTSTVYDVASGGMEYVPFSVQPNLRNALEKAKEIGLWVLGTSENATDDLATVQRDRNWLLVLGNEEKGMRRLTQESCDVVCRIPSHGPITSLNVSVAAGILISKLSG